MKITLTINDKQVQRVSDAFGITTKAELVKILMEFIKGKVKAVEFEKRVREAEDEGNKIQVDLD